MSLCVTHFCPFLSNFGYGNQINGYESQGQEMQRLIGVVWWPTFIVYKDGIEQWRAKIPNPPQKTPTAELESILISVMS